jgi:hypothetical protein
MAEISTTDVADDELSDDTELLMALVDVALRIENHTAKIARHVSVLMWLIVGPILIGLVLAIIGLTMTAAGV